VEDKTFYQNIIPWLSNFMCHKAVENSWLQLIEQFLTYVFKHIFHAVSRQSTSSAAPGVCIYSLKKKKNIHSHTACGTLAVTKQVSECFLCDFPFLADFSVNLINIKIFHFLRELRHTNRKVAGSIPDCVFGIFH